MARISMRFMSVWAVLIGLGSATVQAGPDPADTGVERRQFEGAYVGGHIGRGFYNTEFSDRDGLGQRVDSGLPDSIASRRDGLVGGIQGGYNWRKGDALFGVEADLTFGDLTAADTVLDGDQSLEGGTADSTSVRNRVRSTESLRLRSGIVSGDLLLYVTGGVGAAQLRRSVTYFEDGPVTTTTFNSDRTKVGPMAGAGSEWAISRNWSVKGEALCLWLNQDRNTVSGTGVIGNLGVPYRLDSQEWLWTTRVGLNFHF